VNLPPCKKRAVRLKKEEEKKKEKRKIKDQGMTRARRFSVSLDGDPRGSSCTRGLVPMLLLTSLFFASSAAVISCPSDGSTCCSLIDLRAALNRSRHSFATCDPTAQPSQIPPAAVQQDPPAAAAAQVGKQPEESTAPPVIELPSASPATPAADAATAAATGATPAAKDEQQPQIATFDEWTKAKLQQPPVVVAVLPVPVVPAGTNGGGTTTDGTTPIQGRGEGGTASMGGVVVTPPETATATRNYASRECGAKVIYSNPEAENTKAVLNDKEKDDYMRNPCDKAQHKHIVIELCETILPRSIEIANFELFSSGPASVRFSAAERFPTQQWSVLGEWSLADTRTIQTLPVPADKLIYAKFIKLELLAHHGAEHFCTLSTVRVLGVSMVDEYEAEAAVAARIAAPPHAAPVTETAPPPATPKEQEQSVKKDDSSSASPLPSNPPSPVSSTESPPIAVVETPPVTPKVSLPPPTPSSSSTPGTGIVQEVMSGTLLKKIIEVVGGRKKEDHAPTRPRGPRESAYSSCDRTPAAGRPRPPRDVCVRRHFFCPRVAKTSPAPIPMLSTQERAERRVHARRSLVAVTQRREEEMAKQRDAPLPPPPTQIYAPPHRKATSTTPIVQQQPPPPAAAAPPKEEEKAQQPPPPAAPAATPKQQQHPPPPVGIFEGLAAGTSSHKESVFMKLNKRIAALELNMSLSTEYLSELSRQYIAHTDEQKRAMERTRVAAERAAVDVARTVNETVRDELFNLRKEVDALSAWLATLRQQAGSVALATPRRISGAHAAPDHETSAAPERSSSCAREVGHRRVRQSIIDLEGEEDYVSYEETYERPTCPYGRRTQQRGRAYGPQPRPAREAGAPDADGEEEQTEEADDAFDLRHFRHHSDGIWTTEQVLYAVLGAQALTVLLVLTMQLCYTRFFGRRPSLQQPQQQSAAAAAPAAPPPTVDAAELDRLIAAAIAAALERRAERESEAAAPPPLDPGAAAAAAAADASPRSSASSVTSSEPAAHQQQQQSGTKKKKRRQRRATVDSQQAPQHHYHHHQCRQCAGGPSANLDWDSAMDSSLPSPSQTGSEEEFEAPPPSSPAQVPPTSGSAPSSPPVPAVTSQSPKR
ncbi:hypothetical protein PENTCL1PPCAC_27509, partial [Pristionchus entomophagus]